VVCDLTTPQGGDDTGPTALELAIMALADCAVTIFADVCKQSKIELVKVEAVAEAEKPPDSPILSGVTIKTTVSAKARKELLEASWRRTEANCPVLSIFKEPIPLKVEFEVIPIQPSSYTTHTATPRSPRTKEQRASHTHTVVKHT
jgi:uncharacterized OsmC-like protein